jgi:cell division protein FtsB
VRSRRVLPKGLLRLLIILFLLYPFSLYLQGVYTIIRLNNEIRQVKADIKIWNETNERLREEIVRLEDEKYVEEMARKKLGLVKPGETLFILAEPGRNP